MRHNHSKHRTEIPVTAMRQKFMAAAAREAENSMTKKRFFATFAALFLCVILGYSSLFYVPAYVDFTKPVGLSTQDTKLPKTSENPGALGSYMDVFKMRRGYLSQGQNLILNYDLSPGITVTASIGRCKSPPIVEVFHCQKIDEQSFKVRSLRSGKEIFTIQKPGFYYFDEVVTQADGSPTDKPYYVKWSRGKAEPKRQVSKPIKKAPPNLRSFKKDSSSR